MRYLIFAWLASMLIAAPTAAQDMCSDVLSRLRPNELSVRGRYTQETAHYNKIKRESGTGRLARGKNDDGSFRLNKTTAEAMENEQFSWMKDAQDWQIAISSGDPKQVSAWLECMRDRNPGPVAWLEAPNSTTVRLVMKYGIPADEDINNTTESSFILRKTIKYPQPQLRIEDGSEHLDEGVKIGAGSRIVTFRTDDPRKPVVMRVSTNSRDIRLYLPPRMFVDRDEHQQARTVQINYSPRDTGRKSTELRLDSGWFLVPDSARANVAEAKGGFAATGEKAFGCTDAQVSSEAKGSLTIAVTGDNDSTVDGGECLISVQWREFRLSSKPIPD